MYEPKHRVSRPAIAVGSISLIPALRQEVVAKYPGAKFHEELRALSEDELIDFLRGCDSAVIGLEPLTERVLAASPGITAIGKFGVGCDNVDFDAIRRRGIRFGHQRGVNRLAVAELTICFMIAALRWVSSRAYLMREAARPTTKVGRQLSGRVVGLHGCGFVGKEVVKLLQPFGCEILAYDLLDFPEFYHDCGVTPVDFETLLRRSDVLSLHIPRTPQTSNLYDRSVLSKMRNDCVLINVCRGGIVDEEALADRLEDNPDFAACFDAFDVEPPINDRLLRMPNLLSTPHIGASTIEARLAMGRAAIRLLEEGELVPADFCP
jgi:phosphoglycerate dehydrogenase-like enzyme